MKCLPRLLYVSTILCLISAALASNGCSRRSSADGVAQLVPEGASNPDLFVVERPEDFPLCLVETRLTARRLEANGVIAPDVGLTVHVTSLSGGRVSEVRTKLGDDVQNDQVLVVIRSQDLAQAISDYRKSQADELLARKKLDRARDLFAHGAAALKDVQEAEDAEEKAKVDIETGLERIRILGGDLTSLSPIIEVRSPISGTIVEQNVAGGEGVKSLDNSPNLFTIASLSRVWLLCDVYEDNLSQVRVGDTAEVRLNAYPDRSLKGQISNIARVLDPATRSAKVRIELNNDDGSLRPGMFAVAIFTSQTKERRMVLPPSALLRLHDRDWVFRSDGPKLYRRLEVQAGSSSPDGLQYVLAGLKPGDRVVGNALQFMSTIEKK